MSPKFKYEAPSVADLILESLARIEAQNERIISLISGSAPVSDEDSEEALEAVKKLELKRLSWEVA
jgi:hypothetical protein